MFFLRALKDSYLVGQNTIRRKMSLRWENGGEKKRVFHREKSSLEK